MMQAKIIQDVSGRGGQTAVGLKGIANSTSLGPLQRQRVLDGIIQVDSRMDSRMKGQTAVSSSSVKSATKREIGMVHLPGTY